MNQIEESNKKRIIQFIKENDIDYIVFDDGIGKFRIKSYDGYEFHPYIYEDNFILAKYDKSKDKGDSSSTAYEYFTYKDLSSLLVDLKIHDDSLHKQWWTPILNSAEIGFDKNSYKEDWYKEIINDSYELKRDNHSTYLEYLDLNCKPIIKSPFNTLHEVSEINSDYVSQVNKLNFEIYPISCQEGNESYLFKILYNNEEVLKEYINYIVYRKKGLKLFLENLFKSLEPFKK